MIAVRVFDPAMCCSTGICGPSVDPQLVRFAADLDWLKGQGVSVERFNLSQQPGAEHLQRGRRRARRHRRGHRVELRALLHIRKFGTITNTLAAACELSGTVEAVAPGGSP